MSTQAPQKTTVILSGPNDWDEWLEVVKTKAMGGEIWQYVDPKVSKDTLPPFTEPQLPLPGNVNPQARTVSALSEDEKEELKALRQLHKRQLAVYDRQKIAMATLRIFIQETITRTYLRYTFECDTSYEMLTSLKKRVAPTDQARKTELLNRYQELQKTPRLQNLETWLQQWEKTYKEYADLKLSCINNN